MNYIEALASRIRAEVPASDLPDNEADALFRSYAVLLLAKGNDTRLSDVHNAWVAWVSEHDPTHEAAVPFGDLPASVAAEDATYLSAIQKVARSSPWEVVPK